MKIKYNCKILVFVNLSKSIPLPKDVFEQKKVKNYGELSNFALYDVSGDVIKGF